MKQTNKTREREKLTIWLDNAVVAALRKMDAAVGRPVAESIRRAVDEYLVNHAKELK
jgi:hypothetical protein